MQIGPTSSASQYAHSCIYGTVADPGFWKGGFFYRMPKAAVQRCVVLISPREAGKNFSPLFFSYQGGFSWHLRGLVPKPFGFSQLHPLNLEAVNFVPGTTVLRTVTATYVFRSVLDSCSSPLQASA